MIFRLLCSFFFLTVPSSCLFAQSDSIQYFDHYWEKTAQENAAYYRLAEKGDRFFIVSDFYISGKPQMTGTYTSLEPEIQNGYFIWYFENGQKYAEGNYVHGEREGIWTFWFPDGLKKQEIKFYPGNQDDAVVRWESKRLKNSREIIEKAAQAVKPEKALPLLNSAIQINPYSAEAYYEKALIEFKTGEKEKACEDLLKAREYWFYDMLELSRMMEENCFARHSEQTE